MNLKRNQKDGRLNAQIEIPVHDDFLGKVRIYKIKYMVDDLSVVGFIVKPDEHKKLPALLYNRGGHSEYGKIDSDRLYRLCTYALEGYVVLASQYRGNDGGEGREEFGGEDIRDVFALSWLADDLPYVDKDNKVMVGHSRGGMMTYICIKFGIDIKAAAVIGAPTNLLRKPLAFPMDKVLAEYVGDPEADAEEYRNRSAIYWSEQIKIPIIIQHGDADDRVPYEDATELVDLLKKHELQHKFILYKEGDHGLNNYKTERDKEIFEWFSKYLNI